jgi:wyosine [tRNA(Phe)-imidazoG37] synthetase (radical SAM superfamily)
MPTPSLHRLTAGIIYGPGPSRRYGTTLGVNLAPSNRKACRLSCVYCQLGHFRGLPKDSEFPEPAAVGAALEAATGAPIDAIVLCGNGEPALHPRFPEVVDELRRARDRAFPRRPIVCLTSGSELGRPEVVEALRLLDEVAVKLDAGRCATLRRVALAEGPVCVDWLTWRIRALGDAVVQTCFFEGPLTNASDEEVDAWIVAVRATEARRVDIFTIDRPPPTERLVPVAPERLQQIAERLRAAVPIPVVVAS